MTVIPFPARKPVVFVDPVEDDGGSWGVFFQKPGHAPSKLTTRFALGLAEIAAREAAARLGAVFLDDTAPEPKGAA